MTDNILCGCNPGHGQMLRVLGDPGYYVKYEGSSISKSQLSGYLIRLDETL